MSTMSPPWHVDALRRIDELTEIPTNWDGYGNPAVSQAARATAARVISLVESYPLAAPEIGPESGGALQIEWACDSRELELHVLADQSVEYLKVANGDPVEEGTVPVVGTELTRLVTWLLHG